MSVRPGLVLAALIGGLLAVVTVWLLVNGYEVVVLLLDWLLVALTPNRFER